MRARQHLRALRPTSVSLLTVAVAMAGSIGIGVAAANGPVKVDTVAELKAAVAAGADRIIVAPGIYSIKKPLDLVDVRLSGRGNVSLVNEFNPNAPPTCTIGLLNVAGTVVIENISFKGGGCAYVRSADAGQGIDQNRITVRDSRFGKDGSFVWFNVLLGNAYADASTTRKPTWDIGFRDNHVQGGAFGMLVGNFLGDAPDARVEVFVEGNEFRDQDEDGIVVIGNLGGKGGGVTGTSRGNLYTGARLYGLNVVGGTDDLFHPPSPGGSLATVRWTSIDERFVGNVFGVAAWGGHRHDNIFGPSKGNSVRMTIISPTFKDNELRDVDIEGGSSYGTLAANQKDATTFGAGNTVRLTLRQSVFKTAPGRVWITSQDRDEATSGRFDEPVPDMNPDPSYKNEVVITGSRTAFEQTNPGVNEGLRRIPAAYFQEGE